MRMAGWMPRASSRSSASAVASRAGQLVDLRVLQPRLEHPQVEREADELLLGAVVEVALDPPPRGVARLDDPQPREPQLLHARLQVGLQALVVDRQRRGRRGRHDQLGRGVERGVVDDRREPPAVAVDRGPRPARAGLGQLDRAALLVDEALAVGQPVGDRDGPVAEALREHLAHRPARRHARDQQRVRADARGRGRASPARPAPARAAGSASRHSTQPDRGVQRPRPDVVDLARAGEPADPELRAAARRRTRASSATTSSAATSSGRSARWVAVRHSERSESR